MYYGWLIVFVVALTQAISIGILNYSYGLMVVPLAEEFDASRSSMMFGMTVMMLVSGILSPLLGAQLDKRSVRNMMLTGALFLGTGLILLSYIQAVWQFILIFAIFFSFSIFSLGSPTSSTLVTRWFHRYRGRALGMSALGMSLGGFVMPIITQLLIEDFGWRMAFLMLGFLVLLFTFPILLVMIRNSPAEKGLLIDGDAVEVDPIESASTVTTASIADEVHYSTATLLRQRSFWLMGIAVGLSFSVYSAMVTNFALFAIGQGIEPIKAAQLVSLIAVCGMLGKILFGYAADKVNLKFGLWGAQLLIVTCLLLLTLSSTRSYQTMMAASVALGLAAGGLAPVLGAMLAKVFGTANYGRVMGNMNLLAMGFILTGPIGAGKIFDMTGSYIPAFQLYIGILALAALVLIPLRLDTHS
jgi:sugar phosphate permease